MKTILLTGATGFLGSHLLTKLLENNYEVIVLKRSFSNIFRIKNYIKDIKYYDIDRVDIGFIFETNKIDTVLHSATNYGRKDRNPLDIIKANLTLPLNLLYEGLNRDLKVFINTDTIINKRVNHYSLSKNQFVEWLKTYSQELKCVNISLEHFYGAQDDDSKFVTYIINQILNNADELNLTKGAQKRDFIYIDDVVDGFLTIIKNMDSLHENFNSFEIGSGQNISIKEFVELVKDLSGNNRTKLNFGAVPYRENEIMESGVDVSKLLELGWRPETGLREGLNKTIESERRLMS